MNKAITIQLGNSKHTINYPSVGQEIDMDYTITILAGNGDMLDKLLSSKRTANSGKLILAYAFFKNVEPEIINNIEGGDKLDNGVLSYSRTQAESLLSAWFQIEEWYNTIQNAIQNPSLAITVEEKDQEGEA